MFEMVPNVADEWKGYSPEVNLLRKPYAELVLKVERRAVYYEIRVFFPLAMVVTSAFSCFMLEPAQLGSRLGLVMTLMLTTVASQQVVGGMLPNIPDVSLLDYFVMSAFCLLALFVLEIVIMYHYAQFPVMVNGTETAVKHGRTGVIQLGYGPYEQCFVLFVGCIWASILLVFLNERIRTKFVPSWEQLKVLDNKGGFYSADEAMSEGGAIFNGSHFFQSSSKPFSDLTNEVKHRPCECSEPSSEVKHRSRKGNRESKHLTL
jgi:hypothetical protein